MSNTFKVGDVVQLKSGGPKMTVANARKSDGDVVCIWFSDTASKYEVYACSPDVLTLVGTGSTPGNDRIYGPDEVIGK